MSHDFWKFMVHEFFGIHSPRLFGIQCPTLFCDFGLFNRLAQAGGGGLLYDISLPKTYRPKLLLSLKNLMTHCPFEDKKNDEF
jgi:hypothetical protein